MTLAEYKNKFPLTKQSYQAVDVDAIRSHAFKAGMPEVKETRSQKQNRYYWGVVCKILSQDLGYLPEEIHQLMAKQFLSYENQGEQFVCSTTKLNTKDMEEYLENVRRFASMELSCFIPKPNETEFSYSVKGNK